MAGPMAFMALETVAKRERIVKPAEGGAFFFMAAGGSGAAARL